ncbi:MAG: hypothetical protein C0623_09015 [Desulfuromonas sp.]|nr:MAG: hypothetical protein C0623_09015 [Desulfuromonas sp.]
MQRKKHIVFLILSLTLLLLASGCAVIKGNELPNIDSAGPVTVKKPVPVLFVFQWAPDEPVDSDDLDSLNMLRQQQAAARRIVGDSELFDIVAGRSISPGTFKLVYSVHPHGKQFLAAFSSLLSDMTLTLLPGVEVKRWTMVAELIDSKGVSLWRQEYVDSAKVVTWMPLFPLIFLEGNKMPEAFDDVLRNMYLQPVHDLSRSDIFQEEKVIIRRIR